MCYGAAELLDLLWYFPWLHVVVLLAHFIRKAASPRFDFVEGKLLLVVARFTDVDLFIFWKPKWSAFVVACDEHDKAPIDDFRDLMNAILASLDHFVLPEMFLVAVDRLLWSVVPTSVDPMMSRAVLPHTVYLCNDGL